MLLSIFFRLLRYLIISIICSWPIYLKFLGVSSDVVILLLSFIMFAVVIGMEAYHFSFEFWKIQDYYIGQLIPLAIYFVMGFSTCLIFEPIVFNRIFLPLRFAGCLGMKTIESIGIILIVTIVIVTILSFFGARAGRSFFDDFLEDEYDI